MALWPSNRQTAVEMRRMVLFPMKLKTILLMAAFGLLMSALVAQSANINIPSVPFVVSAPGTYVAAANLVCPAEVSAITVNASVDGPIIIDLKGFTLSSVSPGMSSDSVGVNIQSNPTASSITVRNGGIKNFMFGAQAASVPAFVTPLSNIHVENITFSNELGSTASIHFTFINSSSVNNCTFVRSGIYDDGSQGGNNYSNDSFPDGGPISISISAHTVMQRLSFAAPKSF
jgi:hypothetical protein